VLLLLLLLLHASSCSLPLLNEEKLATNPQPHRDCKEHTLCLVSHGFIAMQGKFVLARTSNGGTPLKCQ